MNSGPKANVGYWGLHRGLCGLQQGAWPFWTHSSPVKETQKLNRPKSVNQQLIRTRIWGLENKCRWKACSSLRTLCSSGRNGLWSLCPSFTIHQEVRRIQVKTLPCVSWHKARTVLENSTLSKKKKNNYTWKLLSEESIRNGGRCSMPIGCYGCLNHVCCSEYSKSMTCAGIWNYLK